MLAAMPDADATHIQPVTVRTPGDLLPAIPGYEVKQLLGQGGMGKVYLAKQNKLQRLVALKLVTAANDEHVLARFEEEVKAIASLKHQHIAQIFESGQCEGRPFYAMEYVAGGTLSDKLKTSPLQPSDAATLLIQLARAMQHAHDQGVIHRDLKPSNVLLEADKLEPKIADFGLAKRLGNESNLTRTGDIFGSPSYMAPEQASGVMTLTPSVDIYALGAILYECLTGRPPFLAPEPMLTIMQVLSSDPVPPLQLQPRLPRDLNTICMKCLEKQPKKRYASAGALADDLERYVQGEPIQARPVSTVERAVKWARRKPWQAVAVGLAALLFLGTLVGILVLQWAYSATQQSNYVFNRSFELSKNTLDSVLHKLSVDLASIPRMENVLLESYRPAVELFRQLHELRPDHQQTTTEYLAKIEQFFMQLVNSKQYPEAEKYVRQSQQLVMEERQRRPADLEWKLAEARYYINHAWLLRQQGKAEQALPLEKTALAQLDLLNKEIPANLDLLKHYNDLLQGGIADDIASSQVKGDIAIRQQHIENAVKKYRQIVANWVKINGLKKDEQSAAMVMSSRKSLATVLVAINQIDEAEKIYQEILESLPGLQLTDRDRLAMQAHAEIDLSDIARRRQDYPKSAEHLKQATVRNQSLRKFYPNDPIFLYDSFSIRYKEAELLHDQGRQSQAVDALRATLKDMTSVVEKRPEYTALSELRKNAETLLHRYENEASPPRGK